jgi:glycosyltransferase involved in cell wall biosynthesis
MPLKGDLELFDDFIKIGSDVNLSLHNQNFFRQILSFNKVYNQTSFVLHVHLPRSEVLANLSVAKDFIISRHYGDQFFPNKSRWLSKHLSRISSRKAFGVIAISKFVEKYLLASGEIGPKKNLWVIPYGINREDFTNNGKFKNLARRNSQPKLLIGTLARLSPEKDLVTLIRATKTLVENLGKLDIQVEIWGSGPELESLSLLVKELSLDGIVKFQGRTNESAKQIASFDTFVLSSQFEGFGLVLLEAMAVNTPIVCSNIETAHEILGDDGAAIYFEAGNSSDLAGKLGSFTTIDVSRMKEKQNNRIEQFSSKKMALSILSIYPRGK